ncbi:hypothetical protein GQR58_025550 [Nymphon striatum]|nr:hypothetical protein GQR58_025550 [Nymphon striatum]
MSPHSCSVFEASVLRLGVIVHTIGRTIQRLLSTAERVCCRSKCGMVFYTMFSVVMLLCRPKKPKVFFNGRKSYENDHRKNHQTVFLAVEIVCCCSKCGMVFYIMFSVMMLLCRPKEGFKRFLSTVEKNYENSSKNN